MSTTLTNPNLNKLYWYHFEILRDLARYSPNKTATLAANAGRATTPRDARNQLNTLAECGLVEETSEDVWTITEAGRTFRETLRN